MLSAFGSRTVRKSSTSFAGSARSLSLPRRKASRLAVAGSVAEEGEAVPGVGPEEAEPEVGCEAPELVARLPMPCWLAVQPPQNFRPLGSGEKNKESNEQKV